MEFVLFIFLYVFGIDIGFFIEPSLKFNMFIFMLYFNKVNSVPFSILSSSLNECIINDSVFEEYSIVSYFPFGIMYVNINNNIESNNNIECVEGILIFFLFYFYIQ